MVNRMIAIVAIAMAIVTPVAGQSYCQTELNLWTSEMEPLMADFARQTYMSYRSGTTMEQIVNATTLSVTSVMSLSVLECDDTLDRIAKYQLFAHYILLNATIHNHHGMEDAVRDANATAIGDLQSLIRNAYNGLED